MLNLSDTLKDLFKSKTKPKSLLEKYAELNNIADELDDNIKQTIINRVIGGIEEDIQTQANWLRRVEEVQKLAKLEKEPKNTPLPQSANIKLPLIRDACDQYAARTYPEVVQDGQVAKSLIIGEDVSGFLATASKAITTHMNWQMLGPDSDWEASLDRLLVVYSNIGFVVTKSYFDSSKKKIREDLCNYKDIILRNAPDIQCLDDLRRITHVLHWNTNDLITASRTEIFSEKVVEEILASYTINNKHQDNDLYESHCFFDLDGDGYEEPYIITIHKQTNKLCRIKARYYPENIHINDDKKVTHIDPIPYFTDYHFLPAIDGSFMSEGFGTLMQHLQEMVNTICNQLIDAGTLANMQTGFMDSRIKIMGGQIEGDPGKWTRVKSVLGEMLKDGMVPIQYKEPSSTLYQLLGMLIEMSKELTSSTDAMQGLGGGTNVPATTQLSMIEQGMKRFSALQKRLNRSLKESLIKRYKLNQKYVDPVEFKSLTGVDSEVYKHPSIRIIPIADPSISSDAQRLSQAHVVMEIAASPTSLISQYEAQKRMLEAAKVPNISALLPEKAKNAPPKPDPKMVLGRMKHQIDVGKLQIAGQHQTNKDKETIIKAHKSQAEINQMQANAVKLIAEAAHTKDETRLQELHLQLEAINSKIGHHFTANKHMTDTMQARRDSDLRQQEIDNQHQQAAIDDHQGYTQMALDQQQNEAENDRANSEGSNNSVDQSSDNSEDAGSS